MERGERHSTRDVSEAGVWPRYDFNGKLEGSFIFGKMIVIGDNMMRLVGIMVCNFVPQRYCRVCLYSDHVSP